MSEQDDTTTSVPTSEVDDTTTAAPAAADDATTTADEPAPKKKRATRKKTAKKASTRTRTRTRTSEKAADAADVPSDDAPAEDAANPEAEDTAVIARSEPTDESTDDGARGETSGEPDKDDAGNDDDAAATRRRRRGSRGGRGRGRAATDGEDDSESDKAHAADQDDAAADDASREADKDDTGEADDEPKTSRTKASTGGRSSTGSRSGQSKSGSSRSGSTKAKRDSGSGDGEAKDDGLSKEDRETEEAIAKGGTRMAAKRRGRSGGGGGGGGSRGGSGGDRRGGPRGVSEETRRAILDGPPRTMLVTHTADRTQIVVSEDRRAVEHYVTHAGDVTYVGNIYMARVQNVLPGMEAAFLDIGKGRNGVLYAGEVLYDEQDLEDVVPRIEDTLKPGQKVLVQVTKDPMGTKGPRLTQHLSLAGRYCVLAPDSDLFGISRKLTDKERDRLRKIIKKVKPEQHGIIVRTAAENATDEALTADLERLLAKWEKVEAAAKDAKPMTAVYEEPKLVVKVIRDNFGPEFERCIVDDKELFEEVTAYLEEVATELVDKVELYEPKSEGEHDKPETLFGAYNVSEQLRKAADRKVWLPSGGYLIIESTEAMKVVDVNTGKFTGSKDTSLEEVVLKTNLEAADEIVRQLRLRDMGGIIIIDFIDMLLKANQDQVIRRLKRELLRDRTKTRVSEVSRLGLVQMTRKNVSQGLVESFSTKCEHCNGLGRILELPE